MRGILAPDFVRASDDDCGTEVHQSGRQPAGHDSVCRSRDAGATSWRDVPGPRRRERERLRGVAEGGRRDAPGHRDHRLVQRPRGVRATQHDRRASPCLHRRGAPRRRHRRDARQRGADAHRAGNAGGHPRTAHTPRSTITSPASAGCSRQCPTRDDRIDLEALLDAVRRVDAPLVYLANPDNPMGTWHDAAQVRAFIDELPESNAACARRGVHRFRARIRDLPDRRGRPEGHPHADVLEGARHGRPRASGTRLRLRGRLAGWAGSATTSG